MCDIIILETEVNIIKHYIIFKYLFTPNIKKLIKYYKTYYNKFKTTDNLYNFILQSSKNHLLNYIKYQYPYLNKHTINSQILNKLSNNKIIHLSNKLYNFTTYLNNKY